MLDPTRGDLIRGSGGLRKLRFGAQGRGKSGGVRVIYYYVSAKNQIYMLLIYPKSNQDNLTAKETALLRDYVKDL